MGDKVEDIGVKLSDEAIAATKQLMADVPEYKAKLLRLYLDGKGCDGFYYGVTFDQKEDGDLEFSQTAEITLIVDPDTIDFVRGSTINWVDDERGKGYLVDNPSHNKFRGKFYKRPKWHRLREQKRLAQAAANNDQTQPGSP